MNLQKGLRGAWGSTIVTPEAPDAKPVFECNWPIYKHLNLPLSIPTNPSTTEYNTQCIMVVTK